MLTSALMLTSTTISLEIVSRSVQLGYIGHKLQVCGEDAVNNTFSGSTKLFDVNSWSEIINTSS